MREFHAAGANAPGAPLPPMRPARKRAVAVGARLLTEASAIATLEGMLEAAAGNFVITAATGEQWPVTPTVLDQRYLAVAPTLQGHSGNYTSIVNDVMARQMHEPFAVVLANGIWRIEGRAGDWLIDYLDGNLGIVAADIFPLTYELCR